MYIPAQPKSEFEVAVYKTLISAYKISSVSKPTVISNSRTWHLKIISNQKLPWRNVTGVRRAILTMLAR